VLARLRHDAGMAPVVSDERAASVIPAEAGTQCT
jgi:hypothetical protein